MAQEILHTETKKGFVQTFVKATNGEQWMVTTGKGRSGCDFLEELRIENGRLRGFIYQPLSDLNMKAIRNSVTRATDKAIAEAHKEALAHYLPLIG